MSGYSCLLCEGEKGPAVVITTSLATGKTGAACEADYPVMLVGALAAELDLDANRLYDTISRFADRELKAAQKALQAAEAAEAASPAADADGQPADQEAPPGPGSVDVTL